jgi:hypothetical protein
VGTLNVRLDEDLEKRLAAEVARRGMKRSEVVRRILDSNLPAERVERSAAERLEAIRHVIGSVDSGIPDLGANHEEHLRRIFDARRDDIMGRGPDSGVD